MGKIKVLIAECNSSVRQCIRYTLQEHFPHFECEVANNGRNIQKRVEKTRYELIIYEREMPMLHGDEFLEWRKGHSVLSTIPVIVMSSDRMEESLKKVITLGADAYLIKPLLMEHLVSNIKKIMGKREKVPGDRRKSERTKSEGKICLTLEGNTCEGHVINISSSGILGIFNSRDGLPNIMDKVQVNIELNNRPEMKDITADVIRIQAVDSILGPDYIQVVVRFDDAADPKKKKEFDRMMSNFQPGAVTT